jgi:polysaccharide export outer membrane protein
VRVAQDGTISLPLLRDIKVANLTVRALEGQITKLLAEDYLVNPQVKVFVKQYAKISILGEVRNPGSYEMREKLTLAEVIALAQGFTPSANATDIKIIRTLDGKKETLNIDFEKILAKALEDIELKANDVIIIEPYGTFSIIGQVAKPGVYNLRKGLTIVEAIGLAGGFTPIAAQNATKIFREENGGKRTIPAPVGDIMKSPDKSRNILIEDKDTIVVPESFF